PVRDGDGVRPPRREDPPLLEQRDLVHAARAGPEPATRRLHVAALGRPRPDERRAGDGLVAVARLPRRSALGPQAPPARLDLPVPDMPETRTRRTLTGSKRGPRPSSAGNHPSG